MLDEQQRQQRMAGRDIDKGQQFRRRQGEGGDDHRREPVNRDETPEPPLEEGPRRQSGVLYRGPHDEAADDEEDVDARRPDGEAGIGPLAGVVEYDRQGGQGP